MTGEDPPRQIDHVNHDPHDNRWENLRLATPGQNSANCRGNGKYKKGVSKSTCGKTFEARIFVNGKRRFLGCFETEEEAHQEYCRAAEFVWGRFACYESKVSNEKAS